MIMLAVGGLTVAGSVLAADMTPQQVAKAWVENLMNCRIGAMGKLCTEDSQDYFELNKATVKKNIMNMNLEGVQTYKVVDTKKGGAFTFVRLQNEKNEKDDYWFATKLDCGVWLVDMRMTFERLLKNGAGQPIPADLLPAPAVEKPMTPKLGPEKVAARFVKALLYKDQKRCEAFIASPGLEMFRSGFKSFAEALSEGEDPEAFDLVIKDFKASGSTASLIAAKKGEDDGMPLTFVIENGEWKIDWVKLMTAAMEAAAAEEDSGKDAE